MSKPRQKSVQPWPKAWVDALSDSSLMHVSDIEVFFRGKTCAASGAVKRVSEDSQPRPLLRAQVAGPETCTAEVWIEGDAIAGYCDCADADEGWFCEHQVAVALVWRDRRAARVARAAPVAVAAPPAEKDPQQALYDFLHGLDAPALAAKLLEFADHDRDIARELQQWRKSSELGDDSAATLTLISEMLAPGRGFIALAEAARFVRRAEAVLPLLQQARARDARAAVALCLHAMRRAWDAMQQADDSDNDIGRLCESIGAEWVLALQSAGPQPASFGDTYWQIQLDDPFGSFDAAAAEAAIGALAMAQFQRVLKEHWRRAKDAVLALRAEHAAKGASSMGRVQVYDRNPERGLSLRTLERLHLAQLERTGRVDEALSVLREDLSAASAHSQVIRYLEALGRFGEATVQAQQGSQAFPDDQRLQDDLLRCLERDGATEQVLVLRRQQFERDPGVASFHFVLKAGQAAGQDVVGLRQLLFDFLTTREALAVNTPSPAAPSGLPRTAAPPLGARDVSLRAEILGSEGRWGEACAWVQPPALCRAAVLNQIARHLPAEQQDQALALLLRVFASAMQGAGSQYREALALVNEIGQRMDSRQRTEWLAQLRREYKAKRGFVRDLPDR